jgi:hypothetical protein
MRKNRVPRKKCKSLLDRWVRFLFAIRYYQGLLGAQLTVWLALKACRAQYSGVTGGKFARVEAVTGAGYRAYIQMSLAV